MKRNVHSKGSLLLLLLFLLAWGQARSQMVSFALKNEPVEHAFSAIQAQVRYRFIYTEEMLRDLAPVTLKVHKAPLPSALNQLFREVPLSYSIEDDYIFVQKENTAKPEGHDISGKVLDEKGAPIAGASVVVKGTNLATSTDDKGVFSLHGVKSNAVLNISSVGYQPTEVNISDRTVIEVRLSISVSVLDETVIMAYGTTTKRLNTGTISKVTGAQIEKQPVLNPLAAMEGRVPGLYIKQSSGVPGSAYKVSLRGQNSITSGNEPLYLVDGVPYPSSPMGSAFSGSIIGGGSPLSNLNPSDIESIEVLKDADATAIYGSRGANGIVMITTKHGAAGRTKVQLNSYSGQGRVPRKMDLLNSNQYLQMRREALKNDNAQPQTYNSPDLLLWDTTRYTDWQRQLIGGCAHVFCGQASISGGDERTQFLLSGAYNRESTVFPGDFKNQSISGMLNLHHSSRNNKFKISFSENYNRGMNNLLRVDLTTYALSLAPTAPPIFTIDGKLNWEEGFSNPFSSVLQKYKGASESLVSNCVLGYQILPTLDFKTSLGYTKTTLDEIVAYPFTSLAPNTPSGPFSNFANNQVYSWIVEPQLNYRVKRGKTNLSVLAGGTLQKTGQDLLSQTASGYSSDALLEDIAAASSITVDAKANSVYRYFAIFGRINYNRNDKFIINLTGRRDGSSRFGPGRQFANFGAIGAGYIFSKEKFFNTHLPFLSFGKLRTSYGITGNDQIGDYKYLNSYSTTQYAYQNLIGLVPTQLYNPYYGWETNKKFELGLDLGLFENNLSVSFDWYKNRSSNLLIGSPLPYVTGFSTINNNLPAIVQNTGIEFEINWLKGLGKKFQWSANFNFSCPRNKLVSYPDLQTSNDANTYVIGQPLFIQKKYHYIGIDPLNGVYTFEDLDKDGNISFPNDLASLKKIAQNFFGGLENKISFKGIELSFLLQFVKQTGQSYLSGFGTPGMPGNQPIEVLNRWQKPGDQKQIQVFTQSYGPAYLAYFNYQNLSDETIIDASFVRLKNLCLSYTLPTSWMHRVHLNSCRFYGMAQNLFTITNYKGLDPESLSTNALPPLRMISAGIQISL